MRGTKLNPWLRLAKGKVFLHEGDCLSVMRKMKPDSIDAVVTDPPYGLKFMGKDWDHGIPGVPYWTEALRVLKPGGHMFCMGGTRTYHRLACAVEDAGFEIRDQILFLYGTGFPKSHDVSKGIDNKAFHDWLKDNPKQEAKYLKQIQQAKSNGKAVEHVERKFRKAAGMERDVVGQYIAPDGNPRGIDRGIQGGQYAAGNSDYTPEKIMTAPATDTARQWQGWGTALKPAVEPIVLARKPLSEKTVAANVLKHGVGALNIDGCRVETTEDTARPQGSDITGGAFVGSDRKSNLITGGGGKGRWPANVIHDGSDEVLDEFAKYGSSGSSNRVRGKDTPGGTATNYTKGGWAGEVLGYADTGSPARFFYCAKANKKDRAGSKHPTIKPLKLMAYLCRLITPPGGTILDPFAGSGTTAQAAVDEGFKCILIEREAEYCADILSRFGESKEEK